MFRNRQEHTHLDYLLIGDSHSDNAYAGTTGAEVVPYETNSIDASNSVLSRDWNRYLEDIAQANVLINGVEQLKESGQISDTEYHSYKAQGEIFRALMMFRMARLWGSFPVITTIAKRSPLITSMRYTLLTILLVNHPRSAMNRLLPT